LKKIKKI